MLEVWSPLTKDNLQEKEKNYSRISSILLFALHALQPEVSGSNEGYTYIFGSCPPPEIQEEKPQNCFLAGIPQSRYAQPRHQLLLKLFSLMITMRKSLLTKQIPT